MFAYIDNYGFTAIFTMLLILIFLGISPVREERIERTGELALAKLRKFLMVMIFLLTVIFSMILWYVFKGSEIGVFEYLVYKFNQNKYPIALFTAGVIVLKIVYYRWWRVWWSDFKKKWVHEIKTEKLSDITDTIGKYIAPKFNPLKYIDLNKGIFVGLELDKQNAFKTKYKPVYLSIDDYKECHKEIIGASRSGKGVSASVIAYQKILLGWGLFYIDPKPDKFIPRILNKACKEAGKKLFIIDLVEGKKGQYAPFRGGKINDIKARVKQVFKIRRTGGDADFYKGQEINLIDEALTQTNRGVEKIYQHLKLGRIQPDVATGIEDVFKELNDIEQIACHNGPILKDKQKSKILYPAQPRNRAPGGISISRAIMESSVVYIRGDTVDVNIRNLVKLVLTEITQEVKRLYPYREDNHVSIDMDEGKFVMSEILSDSMATIAGFGCDMTVQYQALEDIETSIEKDIDMKALAAALHINTQIKLIHGGMAPRTAEYLMEQSGKRVKKITAMDRVSRKELGGEEWQGERMVRDQEENFLTENDFLAMGKFTYALLQRNVLSKICYSSFIDVEDEESYAEMVEGIKKPIVKKKKAN